MYTQIYIYLYIYLYSYLKFSNYSIMPERARVTHLTSRERERINTTIFNSAAEEKEDNTHGDEDGLVK